MAWIRLIKKYRATETAEITKSWWIVSLTLCRPTAFQFDLKKGRKGVVYSSVNVNADDYLLKVHVDRIYPGIGMSSEAFRPITSGHGGSTARRSCRPSLFVCLSVCHVSNASRYSINQSFTSCIPCKQSASTTSSTKPEVHNLSQCQQKRTEPRPGGHSHIHRKFGKFKFSVWFWRYARIQTDRQIHSLIKIFRKYIGLQWNFNRVHAPSYEPVVSVSLPCDHDLTVT